MLTIANQLPVSVGATAASEGRGLRGMRQRVELLGGHIDIGPSGDGWAVKADVPLGAADGLRPGWFCGS
jgi:signal transduction histidine kinase